MDREARVAIERATQRTRKLLEEDFAAQLEGTFDVMRTGAIAGEGGPHLSAKQRAQREKIVAAAEHKRAAGMTAAEAVRDYIRDAAFTTLNRFVALKMLEARGLVQECVSKADQSAGYREFCGLAPGVPLLPDSAGYRLYIESLFDELSTDIKVLFDRRDSASVLWPKRGAFEAMLGVLNSSELSAVWEEDETIGWVYQYFNSSDERRQLREDSPAPRNSRELAIRNQFFTPRYVVEFLVDNTLGRVWIEMYGPGSRLRGRCRRLVRTDEGNDGGRSKKDPRDLRILDPACGSGHFLLYCFDLLLPMYEEAWTLPGEPSRATGHTLRDDYPTLPDLQRAAPALILEHNLHGVDIDPRAAQIAALTLWLRAQRAWKDLGLPRADVPPVARTHMVVAEPMPGDAGLVEDFAVGLDPPFLRDLFRKMVSEMRRAGDLGPLVPIQEGIAAELARARAEFSRQRSSPQFLPGLAPERVQGELDLSGIDDDAFFREAEDRIVEALRLYAETATANSTQRRLFAGDATQGIALIDLLRTRFDVVLMNPPFGDSSENGRDEIEGLLARSGRDIGAVFALAAASRFAPNGYVGALLPTALWFKPVFETCRDELFWGHHAIVTGAHFGGQVLDGATVNVSALVYAPASVAPTKCIILRCVAKRDVEQQFVGHLAAHERGDPDPDVYRLEPRAAAVLPRKPFAYWLSSGLRSRLAALPTFEGSGGTVKQGMATAHEFRFTRAWWEVSPQSDRWSTFAKGGEYSPTWGDLQWVSLAKAELDELEATGKARVQGIRFFGQAGVIYPGKSVLGFNPRYFPPRCGFGHSSPVAFPERCDVFALLALLLSRPVEYLISLFIGDLQGRAGVYPLHYEVGVAQRLPWPDIDAGTEGELARLGREAVDVISRLSQHVETSRAFVG